MLPVHQITTLFPTLEGQALEDLAIDIDLNGQLAPIWTWRGQVIDGRNRCRAIEIVNRWRRERGQPLLVPDFREWNGQGSLVAFTLSLNLHRRHLTESVRGMLAARAAAMLEEEARQRQLEALNKGSAKPKLGAGDPLGSKDSDGENQGNHGRTREKAAKLTNVSPKTVQRAQKILKFAPPELVQAADAGKVKVSKAAAWVGKSPEEILAKIQAEGAKVKRDNAEADTRESFDRWGRQTEELRRQFERWSQKTAKLLEQFGEHLKPIPKLVRWAEKGQELLSEELIRLLG